MMTEAAIRSNNDILLDSTKKEEQNNNANFIMDKDTLITHGSAITVRSQSSSSLADKSAYYSDDAESSHDSIDTIATNEDNNKKSEKDVMETDISSTRRRRALTVTQNSRANINNNQETKETEEHVKTENKPSGESFSTNITNTNTTAVDSNKNENEIQDHIQELQQSTSLIGNQNDSDSDSYIGDNDDDDDEDPSGTSRRHQRIESHRSTMSSIHSFASSSSNYDLLLARLGSKDGSSSTLNTVSNTGGPQEIRTSFERVYNEAVCKGEEEDIDWGKCNGTLKKKRRVKLFGIYLLTYFPLFHKIRILVKSDFGLQWRCQVRT